MIFLTIFECYIIDYNAMKMTIKYSETVYKILPYLSNTDPDNINTNFALQILNQYFIQKIN